MKKKRLAKQGLSLALVLALLLSMGYSDTLIFTAYAQELQAEDGNTASAADEADHADDADAAAAEADDTEGEQSTAAEADDSDDEQSAAAEADVSDDEQSTAAEADDSDDAQGTAAEADDVDVTDLSATDDASSGELALCEEIYIPDADAIADNDTLFAEYFESVLYAGTADETQTASEDDAAASENGLQADSVSDEAKAANFGVTYFEDNQDEASLSLYNQLKEAITQIAADGGSTMITLSAPAMYTYTNTNGEDDATFTETVKSQMQETFGEVIDCLLVDCPSELYWYDKTIGTMYLYYTPTISGDTCTTGIAMVYLFVADDYADQTAGYYDSAGDLVGYLGVDSGTAEAAAETAAKASEVVELYESYSDYAKLTAYKDWICDAVSYNSDAASSDYDEGYGDPWQIIWVFDGDSDTQVVCEGYSKAFQYLCDLSDFDDDQIICYTINGELNGGGHMWNVVRMDDGLYYHVDVTNSDEGMAGSYGGLFLAGCADGSVEDGYTFSLSYSVTSGQTTTTYSSTVIYVYDADTITLYDSYGILTLAEADYVSDGSCTIHTWDDGEVTTEAACTTEGEITYTCSVCGTTRVEAVAATGHSWNDGEVTTEATCTSEGVITYTCITCGESYTETIAATGHVSGEAVTENETAATCTTDGSYDTVVYCTVCGEELSRETTTIAATGHSWDNGTVTTEATCTTKGVRTYTCKNNAAHQKTETIAALGHNYKNNICTRCGNLKTSKITSSAVTLSKVSYTYNGSARKPSVTVKINGTTLKKGTDYTVTYQNNKNAGTATVKITGKGKYAGSVSKYFNITKASQTLTVKTTTKTVKYTKVKKSKQTVKSITKVSGAKGKLTYTKVSGSKYLSVNKNTGKITVKKGTKKGTYTIRIKVKSAVTTNYKAATKTITVKVKVK